MARNLSVEQQVALWESLHEVQETFPFTEEGFLLFAQVVISTLITGNPDLNRVQADMCRYLFGGPLYRMLQAQRGQAKTTLTAIYAVFRIIHNPSTRILIFSQKGKRAEEIAGWCIKIMRGLDFLHFMLPDKASGDKESVKSFDVHWVLKGADKSPSISCESIEAGAQGARADVLIADDVESLQNSRTVAGRELLEDNSREFESICTHGDIIYLGTPQSVESVYNNLPSRGYDIRVWPGRYPTAEELDGYGTYLSPMLLLDIQKNPSLQTGHGPTGCSGAPTCPEMFDDDTLITKEVSQGKAKFQLQYMLSTRLSDDGRFPLKLSDLIVTGFSKHQGLIMPIWASGPGQIINDLPRFGNRPTDKFHMPIQRQYEWQNYERVVMYLDPAGGGKRSGDEMAYAIIGLIGTFIYLIDSGGFPGGYEEATLMKVVEAAKAANCRTVLIEKNFGNGAHAAMLKPLFEKHWPVTIEEVWETGQKELRIIDVLEPVISSHRLVISPDVIRRDMDSTACYALEKRLRYSLLFQLAHITRDKDSLMHDDRLDALAGAVRHVVQSIDYDMQRVLTAKAAAEQAAFFKAWSDPKKRRETLSGAVQSDITQNRNIFGIKRSPGRRKW